MSESRFTNIVISTERYLRHAFFGKSQEITLIYLRSWIFTINMIDLGMVLSDIIRHYF